MRIAFINNIQVKMIMKIRTITTGFNLKVPLKEEQIKRIALFNSRAKSTFKSKGYIVQTTRITAQPWEKYFESKKQIVKLAKELGKLMQKYSIDEFSFGTAFNSRNIPLIYDIIKNSSNGFCTAMVSDNKQINYEAARQSAKLIKRLSKISKDGFDNLRFAALFNTRPNCPFFPAGYHKGPTSFEIGTENSDLIYKAFSKAKSIEKAKYFLEKILTKEFRKVEATAKRISKKEKIKYNGIDVSIAPSVNRNESIAFAFEKLGLGRFGEPGTLTIAKIITDVLRKINIKKCGYSGLMLPVLEDFGLAMRNTEGLCNIQNLLLYSAVCGTGLDTIPLAGNVSERKLYAIILDIASLSIKLNKPLSARLFPIPRKKIGQKTTFRFPYFANSKIMDI